MKACTWLRDRLARVTSSGTVIPELEGIRFLALFGVVLHHVVASYLIASRRFGKIELPRDWSLLAPQDWLINLNLHLYFTIPVFFAVSGFILARPFAQRYRADLPPPSVRIFFLRRLVRLEAPYVLSCLIYFLAIVLPIGHPDFPGYFKTFFPHLAASLFYAHGLIYGEASWINGVAWTLEIDIQFYLLVPLLARIFRIRPALTRRLLLLGLILGCSLASQFLIEPSANDRLRLSLANYLQFFLAGFLIADFYLDRRAAKESTGWGRDAVCLLFCWLIFHVIHRRPDLDWCLPLLLVPAFYQALAGRLSGTILRSPLLTIPGGMCYTVYLYHGLALQVLQPYAVRLAPAAMPLGRALAIEAAVLIPAVFACSAVLFTIIEKPFMVLSRNVSARVQGRAPRTTAPPVAPTYSVPQSGDGL